MSVDYAKQREQFGRPIGSFQAIAHRCVEMLQRVESARAASRYAASCQAAETSEFPVAARIAAAYCGKAYRWVATENIQVHGGIGFTWEHDAHFYLKRAMATRLLLADVATLERGGPRRLTALAAREGVTQPAMTQLVARLQDAGLVDRVPDAADGRVVYVRITAEGQAVLARRRAVRAERVAALLTRLSPDEQAALVAALPAMDALASAQRDDPLVGQA